MSHQIQYNPISNKENQPLPAEFDKDIFQTKVRERDYMAASSGPPRAETGN